MTPHSIWELLDHCVDLSGAPAALSGIPTCGGVYVVADRDGRPVFASHGQNLRRVVVGRLSEPAGDGPSRRLNLSEIAGFVAWRTTSSRFETAVEFWRLMRRYDPSGYRKQMGFGRAWYVGVRPDDRLPRFVSVADLRDDRARFAGPFATRRTAEAWVRMLEDVFDLCRYFDILEKTPDGEPCAYFEMGKCPAPCDGSLPLSDYRRMVTEALDFTLGDREPALARLRTAMQQASAFLAFERAAAIRKTIEQAETLIARPEQAHVADPRTARYLSVQRAGPARRKPESALVKPFYAVGGVIEAGVPVAVGDVHSAAEDWIRNGLALSPIPARTRLERDRRSEGLWLIARFLFQGDRAPGVFLRLDAAVNSETGAQRVRGKFAPN